VREILASLGFRTIEEAVGQVEVLDTKKAVDHWKASGLDLTPLLASPAPGVRYAINKQDHGLDKALDNELIALSKSALLDAQPVRASLDVRNVNRTVGTMLGAEVTRKYGGAGLPPGTIDLTFHGSAGQSFGAFIPRGITLRLYGDANDYVGKGISGGTIVVQPDERAKFAAHENVIAGNVIGYGGTSGDIFIRGVVGERFCVRNSGATAVVEGVGDHGCEYMTGGVVVVLGRTGRNFAAGMSGGRAFILDINPANINGEMVDVLIPTESDKALLHSILSRYSAESGSDIAAELLSDWGAAVERFSLVMPRDYARVLAAMDRAEKEGLPRETYVMEATHG
jgi:glutamate synthase (NADPH/NADH) large chain